MELHCLQEVTLIMGMHVIQINLYLVKNEMVDQKYDPKKTK